tara:strand:+ start:952 stop:1113 length:162 start_codon:yes stop_codon:yes gene_type:complete
MAKKAVANLQKADSRGFTKVIKMVKSRSNGAYSFKKAIVRKEKVESFFSSSKS